MNQYPPEWTSGEIPKRIKDEAGWRCVRCGHPHDIKGVIPCDERCDPLRHSRGQRRMLTVHHLDEDKANCTWWNLAALCQGCHLSIQARVTPSRVWMFEHSEWFKPFVAGYYTHLRGLPAERDYVLENMEWLLRAPEQERATIKPLLNYQL